VELVRMLASAGKHIYAEKPVADNMADMIEIQEIVREAGIVLTVGHNRRMAPAILEAREILNKHRKNPVSEPWRWDRIGERRPKLEQEEETMILMRINDDHYSWKEWCYGSDAGILLLELNHFTDLAYYFTGSEPVSVSAAGDSMMNVVLNIKFECGSICTIFDACVGSFAYPKELYEIYHKGAVIAVDHCMEIRTSGIPGEPFRRLYPSAEDPASAGIESFYMRAVESMRSHKGSGAPLDNPGPDKGHYSLLDAFMRACRDGAKNPCAALDGSRAAAVVIKAAESLDRNGAPRTIEAAEYMRIAG
jgi:predicted dehydrogenase